MILAADEEAVGGISVILPHSYEIFWAAIVALVLLLVVGWFGLPRIYRILDEREAKIVEGLEAAERAKADSAAAERERDKIIREANQEAHDIRTAATEEAKKIVATARANAQTEAQRINDNAQRQIQADRQAAEITLKSDVALLATELAERIVGEQLTDTALTSRVVDRFLDELEAQNQTVDTH